MIESSYETNSIRDSADERRVPDFLVIGEMRCGSTTLWEMLDRHPSICFPEEKELHYFDRRWEMGGIWYSSHFSRMDESMVCGEATPDYMFCDGVCARILNTIPNAKLLVILRDPTARAWSHYWHNVRRGREFLSFEDAISAEDDRLKNGDEVLRSHFAYVARGHYIRRLRTFQEAFGRNRMCVLFLEDLTSQPDATMLRALAHLGLEPQAGKSTERPPQRNRSDYPRWPRFSSLTSTMMGKVRDNPLLGKPAAMVAKATRSIRTYSGKTHIDPAVEERLRDCFRESDQELRDWIGGPVPWAPWGTITSSNSV